MKYFIALIALAMAICLVPAALADATQSVYGGSGKTTQKNLGTSEPVVKVKAAVTTSKPKAQSTSGNLPFTGMDLGIVALAGFALAGMGYSLRRLARDNDK